MFQIVSVSGVFLYVRCRQSAPVTSFCDFGNRTDLYSIYLTFYNCTIHQSCLPTVQLPPSGGWSHASIKYLTKEQYEELRADPIIKQYGLRRFVGMPKNAPFQKSHVEIGYSDAAQAHFMFCDPKEGRLPREGTNEDCYGHPCFRTFRRKPVLGTDSITFDVDGRPTTQTFILSGWWEYDDAIVANHVLIPESGQRGDFRNPARALPRRRWHDKYLEYGYSVF